ncbi:MAG: thiamine phosphate synthase [Thermogutta sp.]
MRQKRREFTPGALRALTAATTWKLGDAEDGLRAEAVLLGLLEESECRAALTLRECGIDQRCLLREWPELRRSSAPPPPYDAPLPPLHPDLQAGLAAIDALVDWGDWPSILSTEHLLLGLAAADHAVGAWLRSHGVDPDEILRRIHARYGTLGRRTVGLAEVAAPEPPSYGEMGRENDSEDAASIAAAPIEAGHAESPEETESPGGEDRGDKVARLAPDEAFRAMRVIDASANRAAEGLRVLEDYVRFVLDDPFLTGELKGVRHELAACLERLPIDARLAARETLADVGTDIKGAQEARRQDFRQLVDANFSRVREALRSLEEYAKLVAPELAAAAERLRYRLYTLHRAVRRTDWARKQLAGARLYVLMDGCDSEAELERLCASLVGAGVHVLQLREKRLDDRALIGRARAVRRVTRGTDTLFIMNDRPDLAVLAEADGVHVGQEELSVKDARTVVGCERLVGVSTHNIEQARQAVLEGADYIGCGPTFPSPTKRFEAFPGLAFLRQVAAEIRLPAFAIGGIREGNLGMVLETGFYRVAISSGITGAEDPAAAAKRILDLLSQVAIAPPTCI